jgi:hypothetical protein
VNGGLARRSTISIAFSALVLGGLCVQATAAPRSVKACELLASVVDRDFLLQHPSAAVAHEDWESLWHQARAAGRKAVRLPGSGAGPGLRGDTEDLRDVLKDLLPGVPRS